MRKVLFQANSTFEYGLYFNNDFKVVDGILKADSETPTLENYKWLHNMVKHTRVYYDRESNNYYTER